MILDAENVNKKDFDNKFTVLFIFFCSGKVYSCEIF